MITIRRAKEADAVFLAPRLRAADRDEIQAALGMTPEAALPLFTNGNYVWAGVEPNGEPFGLFGIDPVNGNPHLGIVWMVSTPAILKYRRDLLTMTPKWLKRLHRVRPLLGNHIDARNTLHIRWLRRMGFSFLRTHEEFGVEKRPFHEFARLRS
ncbi:hypothetical protein FJ420_01945 [Mesorhizobium sp. B3-1-3]|uniref:hypothetical protein n=1 Tax=unclassified Mesorhizobium TaxID=325217 RepID=UPI00112CAD9E|nr:MULTISPECIES: hypothetical protein [unclassified Mesorhizobium]TPI67597.1 hypothetical protein FJ424_09915 [Mesorhizobium sp. B3-1-8]TPI75643.1 hypothetical protein FJ420_01945 [Mesorhizobium sp. B3-1-3]